MQKRQQEANPLFLQVFLFDFVHQVGLLQMRFLLFGCIPFGVLCMANNLKFNIIKSLIPEVNFT